MTGIIDMIGRIVSITCFDFLNDSHVERQTFLRSSTNLRSIFKPIGD